MSIEQVIQSKLKYHMKEMDKYLDLSFDKINNFIDQVFILDNQVQQISNCKSELLLPKVKEFDFICQSQFQQNMLQELTPLINQKIKDVHQQSLINQYSQLQLEQDQEIKSQSQINLKPFTYQIIQDNSIKQQNCCRAFAFNTDCSTVAVGCENQIILYEFKQGVQQQIQILDQHKSYVFTLNFMKKSNQLISGSYDKVQQK